MKEKNSDSSQKSPNIKVKITNTESFSSFNSNFSANEKDNNFLKMNKIIQSIIDYQTPNDGKIKDDDEISFLIKKSLYEINKKIYNILDFNNNSFLHILVKNSNYYPLKIICDTYYILLDDENLFFKWFLLENNDNLTAMDIASTIGNKKILSYLFSVLSKANKSLLKFDDINNKKNTIFHYSAKKKQIFLYIILVRKTSTVFSENKNF